jgi:demethylmenaquinone methyltransferase / 2-methoxy-6-polyprenyl-1,4-benzoquinol methylase
MANPYNPNEKNKKEQVSTMFNAIAHRYDFLNHVLSMGIDRLWRRRAINNLKKYNPKQILDIATGTGDFAIASLRLNPISVIGIDISEGMLQYGNEKIAKRKLSEIIKLEKGDSENLHFGNETFDAVTVGFGVRNFENLEKGLSEMHRILRKGGVVAILEFSKPTSFPRKQLYWFYFKNILPVIGKLFSKDHRAYTYLPESVEEFPFGKAFEAILTNVGFINTKIIPVSFGIATIYMAEK